MKRTFELFTVIEIALAISTIPNVAWSEWNGTVCNAEKIKCVSGCTEKTPRAPGEAECSRHCDIAAQTCITLARGQLRWEQAMKRCISLPQDRDSFRDVIVLAWRRKEVALQAEVLTIQHFRASLQTTEGRSGDDRSRERELAKETEVVAKNTSDLIADWGGLSPADSDEPRDIFNEVAGGKSAYQVLTDAASKAVVDSLKDRPERAAVVQEAKAMKDLFENFKFSSYADGGMTMGRAETEQKMESLSARILSFQGKIDEFQRDYQSIEVDSLFRSVQTARAFCNASRSSSVPTNLHP